MRYMLVGECVNAVLISREHFAARAAHLAILERFILFAHLGNYHRFAPRAIFRPRPRPSLNSLERNSRSACASSSSRGVTTVQVKPHPLQARSLNPSFTAGDSHRGQSRTSALVEIFDPGTTAAGLGSLPGSTAPLPMSSDQAEPEVAAVTLSGASSGI